MLNLSKMRSAKLLIATLLAFFAFARAVDFEGCVAAYSNTAHNYASVGVVGLDADDCATFAQYQGQPLPHVTTASASMSYCWVPYSTDVPTSIRILRQEGYGQLTACTDADSQAAGRVIDGALSQGLLSNSGLTPSPLRISVKCTLNAGQVCRDFLSA